MTTGAMSFKDGKVLSHEVVSGNSGGTSEVRGTAEMQPDGAFHVKTEHQEHGEWVPGHEVTYKEDPSAKVIFR